MSTLFVVVLAVILAIPLAYVVFLGIATLVMNGLAAVAGWFFFDKRWNLK